MKWATSAKLESLLEVHVAVEVRFDAAILLAHLAHALRGRAQGTGHRVGKGKGKGGAALLCGARARMTSTIYSPS